LQTNVWGKLSDSQTSFYEGRMNSKADGLYYWLGNSILEELRKSEHPKERNLHH